MFSLKKLGPLFCSVFSIGSVGKWSLLRVACRAAAAQVLGHWVNGPVEVHCHNFRASGLVHGSLSCCFLTCVGKNTVAPESTANLFLLRIFACCTGFWRTPGAWLHCEVLFACLEDRERERKKPSWFGEKKFFFLFWMLRCFYLKAVFEWYMPSWFENTLLSCAVLQLVFNLWT